MHPGPPPGQITRRRPSQPRALETFEAIFQATAAIIESDGAAAVNTNRVAHDAGIAIGTLYGYFPNKAAILLAMARRDLEETQTAVAAAIAQAPPGDIVRAAIRALIGGFGGSRSVRRALLQAVVAEGRYEELARPLESVARAIRERAAEWRSSGSRTLTPAQAFVLTRAVVGVIRAAAFEDSPLLGTPEFEDELVTMTRGYLGAAMGMPV